MKNSSLTAAVVGAGSWGTALALHLARSGSTVRLWVHDPARLDEIRETRENRAYLPGFSLPGRIHPTGDLEEALTACPLVVWATPARHLRAVAPLAARWLHQDSRIVIATKGIEPGTGLRNSEVLGDCLHLTPRRRLVLSGPNFAREVAKEDPTAGVLACSELGEAEKWQETLSHGSFRLYANEDVIGVEMGGALKNVIALAAGVVEGLGYGFNTAAALMTRGLSEMTRLGVGCGGHPATFSGLAGMGDLVLTCTGRLSRNRSVGVRLGRGESLEAIMAGMKMVAEGVTTAAAALVLAETKEVDMPITRSVEQILRGTISPRDAVTHLLARPLKTEDSWSQSH